MPELSTLGYSNAEGELTITSDVGKDLHIFAGGETAGGTASVDLKAGEDTSGSGGGIVYIQGGDSTAGNGGGGPIFMDAGDDLVSGTTGAKLELNPAWGDGNGGTILVQGGQGNGVGKRGGDVTITPGLGLNSAARGRVIITNLPTADPGVAGQLYTAGALSAGTPRALMISGG